MWRDLRRIMKKLDMFEDVEIITRCYPNYNLNDPLDTLPAIPVMHIRVKGTKSDKVFRITNVTEDSAAVQALQTILKKSNRTERDKELYVLAYIGRILNQVIEDEKRGEQ